MLPSMSSAGRGSVSVSGGDSGSGNSMMSSISSSISNMSNSITSSISRLGSFSTSTNNNKNNNNNVPSVPPTACMHYQRYGEPPWWVGGGQGGQCVIEIHAYKYSSVKQLPRSVLTFFNRMDPGFAENCTGSCSTTSSSSTSSNEVSSTRSTDMDSCRDSSRDSSSSGISSGSSSVTVEALKRFRQQGDPLSSYKPWYDCITNRVKSWLVVSSASACTANAISSTC
jgi:hypothetical protein